MGVGFRAEGCQNIVVFVNRLSEVASVLRIPPLAVGVTELALLGRRIDIAAVLGAHHKGQLA